MNPSLPKFLSEITKPSAVTEWLTSDHVTAICERMRKEDAEQFTTEGELK